MRLKLAAAAATLATALSGPAAAQMNVGVAVGNMIANNMARGRANTCKVLIGFDERSAVWKDDVQKLHGVTVETFWSLAKSDPKAASKMVVGGKKGGIKGLDGVVRHSGPMLLKGIDLLEGPFALVKFTYESLGHNARGVWQSADGATLQTVDFRLDGWGGGWNIHRIVISDAANAPPTPDKMCSMEKEALPLW